MSDKESACHAEDTGDMGLIPGWERFLGVGNGNPLHEFLPVKSHGQKTLVAYSPWVCRVGDN